MNKNLKNLKINLHSKIINSDNTFIIAHDGIDLDGLGAAVGLSLIPSYLKKDSYIVIDENSISLDSLVKKIINDKCSNFRFINKEVCLDLLSGNDLLILTDVNGKERISLGDSLNRFSDVFVVDHHELGATSIRGDNTYIFNKASSASEIVENLLRQFQIRYDKNVATLLLAGINLDTSNYTKNRNAATLRTIACLMDNGGDDAYITSLFIGDYSDNIKRYEVASRNNTEFRTFTRETMVPTENDRQKDTSFCTMYSIAIATDPMIREKVVLAQAADYLLDFADVSITLANIDDKTVSIHGRSKGQINVGEMFKKINGGGSIKCSAAELYNCTVEDAKTKILSMFPPLSSPKKFV